jgi:5-methylcytosine-specific restriction endonuclease McrA
MTIDESATPVRACSKCGHAKPLHQFHASPRYLGGFTRICKACRAEYAKAWAKRNRDKVEAKRRRYIEAHPERVKESQQQYRRGERGSSKNRENARRWYAANLPKVRAYVRAKQATRTAEEKKKQLESNRKWVAANIDKKRAYTRAYVKRNLEKANAAWRKRRAKKLLIPGSHTEAEWRALVKSFKGKCVCCGVKPDRLTRDHIIPLGEAGSSDNIDNIQPLCGSCNCRKGNHHRIDFRKRPFMGMHVGQLRLLG